MKIALTGTIYSGKTSVSKYIEEYMNGYLMNYTDLLKNKAVSALNSINVEVTEEDIVSNKKRYRGFLQELGTAIGFDSGYGVDDLLKKWEWYGKPEPVVFDNVRWPAQYKKLKGFELVKLAAAPYTVLRRAPKGVTEDDILNWLKHPAEIAMSNIPCRIIHTDDMSIEDVAREVMHE